MHIYQWRIRRPPVAGSVMQSYFFRYARFASSSCTCFFYDYFAYLKSLHFISDHQNCEIWTNISDMIKAMITNSPQLMHWQITTPAPLSISPFSPSIRHFWEIVSHEIELNEPSNIFDQFAGHQVPSRTTCSPAMWRHTRRLIVSIFRPSSTWWGWCWNFHVWWAAIKIVPRNCMPGNIRFTPLTSFHLGTLLT